MKINALLLFSILNISSCTLKTTESDGGSSKLDSTGNKKEASTSLQFVNSTIYNFGKIGIGKVINHAFVFKNVGTKPLIIEKTFTYCGCTITQTPTKPIPVGGVDSVVAVFDSKSNGLGIKNKVVTIMSNAISSPDNVSLYGVVE